MSRLLSADVGALALEVADPVDDEPRTSSTTLDTLGDTEIGVWSIDVGVARDTEVDEVFVVLSGRASVTVEGSPTLELGPGSAVRLNAGDRTTWVVHEPLRKLYVSLG